MGGTRRGASGWVVGRREGGGNMMVGRAGWLARSGVYLNRRREGNRDRERPKERRVKLCEALLPQSLAREMSSR
jgi:hypothetical protein